MGRPGPRIDGRMLCKRHWRQLVSCVRLNAPRLPYCPPVLQYGEALGEYFHAYR